MGNEPTDRTLGKTPRAQAMRGRMQPCCFRQSLHFPLSLHPLVHFLSSLLNVGEGYDVIPIKTGSRLVAADFHGSFALFSDIPIFSATFRTAERLRS